jgi:hypothetical protein
VVETKSDSVKYMYFCPLKINFMIYKFRVILDADDDVFRDIAIEDTATLEDLNNTIINAFGFDGNQMASFYTCDDKWNQDEEIPLTDTGEIPGEISTMGDFVLSEVLYEEKTKIIYVYDFFQMWTFLVELGAIEEAESGVLYPSLLFAHGILPDAAPEKEFDVEEKDEDDEYIDDEDLEDYADLESYDDY